MRCQRHQYPGRTSLSRAGRRVGGASRFACTTILCAWSDGLGLVPHQNVKLYCMIGFAKGWMQRRDDSVCMYVCIFLFEFASTHGLQAQLHGSECHNEAN